MFLPAVEIMHDDADRSPLVCVDRQMLGVGVPPAGFIEPMLPTLVDAAPDGEA